MNNNFQRVGAISNSHAGREFEENVQQFFTTIGMPLTYDFKAPVGHHIKKHHRFDLGSDDPAVLVECKSYTWTSGGNSPSAKIRSLNEVMLLFSLAPQQYRKILVILRHLRNGVTLGSYYVKSQGHLVAPGVEIWEFDPLMRKGEQIL